MSHKIAVLGVLGVGKSSITIQFVENYFVAERDPTMESSFKKDLEIGSKKYSFEIHDTGAGDLSSYSAFWDLYFVNCDGFLLVYDITSNESLQSISLFVQKILLYKDVDKAAMVLVGNKCDLEDKRKITIEEGEEQAKTFDCPFFEVSAKTRINISEIFISVSNEIENLKSPEPTPKKQRDCIIY